MHLTGIQTIAAPRQAVWNALHDVEVLRTCIPGCVSARFKTETRLVTRIKINLGVIAPVLKGGVHFNDVEPPTKLAISGAGKGGLAGDSIWRATVTLDDADGGTRLSYDLNADLGGKLAQLGAFVLEPVIRRTVSRFLGSLSEAMAQNRKAVG
ncbi:carbon monoxide dehydrogenase subunit G [Rhizobium sp. TRM95111]|uniref:CoxG family protein n=1 Tax=Rhizobium alarense TaxID=2846851 RepID=UPI001F3158D8|nr:carbon monoxide dehydrogenase subunit G [Rhizobium alarense]MCF3639209.1 carbon monoxide dehydrogenase subunit G [Rhizobium alarense]